MGATAGVFFIAAVFVGSVILVSVFLAIGISDLASERAAARAKTTDEEEKRRRLSTLLALPSMTAEPGTASIPPHVSLGLFTTTNPLRRMCHALMALPLFQYFVLLCIVASTAVLGAYDYQNSQAERNETLDKFELAFIAVFAAEAVVKIIAMGLVAHEGAYLRSGWNVLDFTVVVVAVVACVPLLLACVSEFSCPC